MKVSPCPFCGERLALKGVPGIGTDFYVQCQTCSSCGPYGPDLEAAVNQWNNNLRTNEETKMREDHKLLQFFNYAHLPAHLQELSKPFHELAHAIWDKLQDNPETTTALRKLLEAKDCAVRSVIYK